MIGIYKITSPLNRIYIGQSINIENRWKEHRLVLGKNKNRLYNSFIKYGVKNHFFEVIEECDITQLNIRERYWQDYYNVLEEGLNCVLTKTNSQSGKRSEETKLKISNTKKGVPQSDQTKINISEGRKGMLFSDKHKESMSKSRKGSPHIVNKTYKNKGVPRSCHIEAVVKAKNKSVIQYDLNNNFIKEWPSGKEASRKLNLQQAGINGVCNNKGKKCGGFIWKFKIDVL